MTTLPVDTAIQHPVVRGLAEGMAVTGWLLLAMNNMFGSYFFGQDSIFYKIASLWFYSSPLWILLVLWNNMERERREYIYRERDTEREREKEREGEREREKREEG